MPVDRAVRIAALDEGRLRDRLDGYLNFGWSAAAANDLSQLSFTHSYDSDPQSFGATRSDWSLFTALGYQF